MAQETQTRALHQPREMGWGGRFQREGIYVYLWLIHAEVSQKKNFVKQLSFNKNNFFKKAIFFYY